jgi:glycosyltransferase involved in cell wall biosynthesis
MDIPMKNKGQPLVFMVDSVGEHRGMHYFNLPLVSALNRNGARAVLLSTPETARNHLRPSDLPVRGVFRGIYGDRSKWWRGALYAIALARIAWWCLRERPGIVHFHFFQIPALDYLLLRLLELAGIRTVTTVHDVLPFELGKDLDQSGGRIFHRLYSCSSGLILLSRRALKVLEQFDSSLTRKAALIPQGGYSDIRSRMEVYVLPVAAAKSRLSLDPSEKTILVFGTIKKNKRLDLVLRAIHEMSNKHPRIRLLVVGKPQDRDVSSDVALAKELDVQAKVVWRLEHVTDEELSLYFSAADVVVFPYQWIFQSAALVMAMSFSKPVIATAVEGNEEWVTNGVTGLLVPLDNAQEMARAIEYVFENPQRAADMGRAACDYVTSELSWDKIAQSTLDFYRNILTKTRFL